MTGCRNIITLSYPMITNVVSLIPTDREVFLIQLFVIKFVTVSVLWKVSGYLWAFDPVSSTNKVDSHNITEILFKVALSTPKTIYNVYPIIRFLHAHVCYKIL
jgi:hypothetical protein